MLRANSWVLTLHKVRFYTHTSVQIYPKSRWIQTFYNTPTKVFLPTASTQSHFGPHSALLPLQDRPRVGIALQFKKFVIVFLSLDFLFQVCVPF